jgi:molecular chaperone GrpE
MAKSKEEKCTCCECEKDSKQAKEVNKSEEKCSCGCQDCNCNEPQENYLEIAQRIQAEFDNYRKRSAEVVRIAREDGIIDSTMKFLPALDAIQKAKTMIKDNAALEGVILIEKEIKNSLKNLDIEEIESVGKHFDPKYHNVIAVKYGNSLEDGIIVDVYQAGYKIKDRIIRYAQVIVNKNKEDLK